MMEDIKAGASAVVERDEEVKQALAQEWGLANEPNAEQKANIIVALDCAVRLFNVIASLRHPNAGRGYLAIMDLTVTLNSNPFWTRHGMVLMPLLHSAIQAQADYAFLAAEKQADPNRTRDDELRAQCKLAGTELFVMMTFLLGGPQLMAATAINIKRKLGALLG